LRFALLKKPPKLGDTLNRFLQNLSLLLFRLTLGLLVLLFAAKELAKQWNLTQPVIEYYDFPGAEWVYVIPGILIFLLGLGLIVGFYTRLMSLALFAILAFGATFYKPVDSGVAFQLIALYGVILLGLLIAGGGQWALKRSRSGSPAKASVLESEQSLLSSHKESRSIFEKVDQGEGAEVNADPEASMSTLKPPQERKALAEEEDAEELPLAEASSKPELTDDEEDDYPGDDTDLDKR